MGLRGPNVQCQGSGSDKAGSIILFRDISSRTKLEHIPLITTDGFAFNMKVIRRVYGPECLYGQVIKARRNDRII
jgi:hypothetical protein